MTGVLVVSNFLILFCVVYFAATDDIKRGVDNSDWVRQFAFLGAAVSVGLFFLLSLAGAYLGLGLVYYITGLAWHSAYIRRRWALDNELARLLE